MSSWSDTACAFQQVHSGGMPGGPHQQVINMQSTMDLGMLDVMDSSIGFGVGGIGIGASALGMDMGFGMGMPGNGRILGKRGMSRIEEMREKRRLQGGQSLLKFMGETAPTLSVTGAAPPPDPPAGPGLGKGDAPSPISSMAPGDGRDEIETMPFAAGSGHVDTTGGITPAKDRAQAEDIVDAANLIQKQHGEGCARPEIKPGEDGARGQAGGHGQGALMEAAEDTSEVEISASAPEPKLDLTSKSEGDRRPEVVSAPSKATAIKRSNLELEKVCTLQAHFYDAWK